MIMAKFNAIIIKNKLEEGLENFFKNDPETLFYSGVEITEKEDDYIVYVWSEVDYDTLVKLGDSLNPIIEGFGAYFDAECHGRLIAWISKDVTWKTIGYGVNIGHLKGGDVEYERFDNYSTYEEAKKAYDILVGGGEQHLWVVTQLEEIRENSKGDIDYSTLNEDLSGVFLEKSFWDNEKTLISSVIQSFELEADKEADGTIQNICWLKLGYFSPSSDCGFFHFSSVEEYKKSLWGIKHISDSDVTATELKEYLKWLGCNEVLFEDSAEDSQIAQLVACLYHR